MQVLTVRNVHEALPKAMKILQQVGVRQGSRNGEVIRAPGPVTTEYVLPAERVIFWPQRDANPFFHLFEALWMLIGANKVEPLTRYAKNMANYADDDQMHGAYGHRWRFAFGVDQLDVIVRRLQQNPLDRQCVLQMWDTGFDLDADKRDLPCNVIATFQFDTNHRLELNVFNRSNDIIWGCYGANAVHFAFLHEYIAYRINAIMGQYRQISVNWHAYTEVYWPLAKKLPSADAYGWIDNPYAGGRVRPAPLEGDEVDRLIQIIVTDATTEMMRQSELEMAPPWAKNFYAVLRAHEFYRNGDLEHACLALERADHWCDWVVAAKEWLMRRGNNL